MTQPVIAARVPKAIEVEQGKTYYWCSCGRSANQPFCDGSHQGTGFEPLAWTAEKDGKVAFCQCKHSNNPPLCDGSHNALPEASEAATDVEPEPEPGPEPASATRLTWYRVADAGSMQDGEVRTVHAGSVTVALTCHQGQIGALDNACPHQGGPLSEGSIECEDASDNCYLRCPWHGWDFDPLTGKSPGGFDDGVPTYPVEERDDGIYVQVEETIDTVTTVSNLMVDTMVNWGVTHVFGMVGHSNLGLADAIRVAEQQDQLSYIGIRHEGAAAFACSGYAKLSGRPAACLTIAGPGATNLLTGLWDAKVDRAPVLALTGQVNTQVFGPGAFQDIDLASAFEAVTRFSQTVLPGSRHAELMTLALKHAIVERDVAHLIFPDEVQVIEADEADKPSAPDGRLSSALISPDETAVGQVIDKLNNASRPAIIVGYGAREAMPQVLDLAERLNAPVLTTFKAKGQLPDSHPLAAGVLGRSGTPIASWCMNEADLLLVFGASFSNHTGISAKKTIVQVDFERMALGKFHPVDVPVWGEIGLTANRLLEIMPADLEFADQRLDLAKRWQIWREEKARRRSRASEIGINSATIFEQLSQSCPANAVIAVDVGNNTYSFGRYFECQQQAVLMSGYLGSIGFGFPAAMGAWAATQSLPEQQGRPVISISGDGGFGQYLAEFTTAVKYGMNITHILLNNSELGKISKEQRAGNWEVWQTSLHNPSFAEFANSCGGLGLRVDDPSQLQQAMEQALAHPGPALLEIISDPDLI